MASQAVKAMVPTSPTGTERQPPQPPTQTDARRGGFTLVELLVALSLIMLIAAALTPMLLPSPARTLQAAAGELVVTLRETRRTAQVERRRNRFVMDTEALRYGDASAARWRSLPPDSTVEITAARGLTSDDGRGGIEFFPDGSSTGGRIRLGLDGHVAQVDVAWLTGQVRLSAVEP